MYTPTQFVNMAIAAPMFRDRVELISDGYKNPMAMNDMPCVMSASVRAQYRSQRSLTKKK